MKTIQRFLIAGALSACAVLDLSAMPTKEEPKKAAPIEQKMLAPKQATLVATERTRKAIDELFPGWTLDTDVEENEKCGFHAIHRGQRNVVCVQPKYTKMPVIISRTMVLSGKDPYLFLKVASESEYYSRCLLSVRVNGKESLPNRLIGTPDSAPWEDIVVSLSDWRGSEVKIEVVFTSKEEIGSRNSGSPFLARLEVAERNGAKPSVEGKETIDGYTWSYRSQNGEATIIAEIDGRFSCAVSPCPIGDISIPATLGGAKVTRLGRDALRNCCDMTSVTIPEGVWRLGPDSFWECTGLRSVEIPPSVEEIASCAFHGCCSLTSVTLPSGLMRIGEGVFSDCCALSSVTIPSGVMDIGQFAFVNCSGLTEVTLPQTVTNIGSRAFQGCQALTTVTIPASVTKIGISPFSNCGPRLSISVEPGNPFYSSRRGLLCTKDGERLVSGVGGDVTIPQGVKNIDQYAFYGLDSLTAVTIPESVTNIGERAFDCTGIKSLKIPSNVKRIESYAFFHCGLTSVTIPGSVTDFGSQGFSRCDNLASVTMLGERPNAPDDVFKDCRELKSIHVPANAKSWAGMEKWQGIPLVFDAKAETVQEEISAAERSRKALAKVFPGWVLHTEDEQDELCRFQATHRGQVNVLSVHPLDMQKPVGLSYRVKLSNRSPCLFLKAASESKETGCYLSVDVRFADFNEALPKRLVCTSDSSPWEDIIVPLSDWRSREVEIRVYITANEMGSLRPPKAFLARLEVGEGDGNMRVIEGKETIDGYDWSYRAQNGEATIVFGKYDYRRLLDFKFSCAVSPDPIGRLAIPETINGAKVTRIGNNAFKNCTGLAEVTIPSSVRWIGRDAFYGCKVLESITLPTTLTNNYPTAFGNCPNLKSFNIVKDGKVESVSLKTGRVAKDEKERQQPQQPQNESSRLLSAGKMTASETATERTRKDVARLFPGWTLDTEVEENTMCGFHDTHCGQSNVVCVQPKCTKTPVILSRTMVLSDKDPCLFLKVASWSLSSTDMDNLLSVRVNGKDALPPRIIATTSFVPWEDIVVPLSDWRGSEAKIEVVISAKEVCSRSDSGNSTLLPAWRVSGKTVLARLEVAESNGAMPVVEGKETVDGSTWSYRAQNGEATIIAENGGQFSCAVSPWPIGHISLPATLGGAKVTSIGRGAFKDCSGLTSVTIPEGIVRIGGEAFLSCWGIRSVTIPSSVKFLEWGAFGNCYALTTVTLSDGLTDIGSTAFDGCTKLKSVNVVKDGKVESVSLVEFGERLNKKADLNSGRSLQRGVSSRSGNSLLGGAGSLRERRRLREEQIRAEEAAERAKHEKAKQEAQKARAAEIEEQRRQLEQIQEELRRARDAREARKAAVKE